MSNYYDYREVKVMIAHKLMAMDGWKVYGYKEDRSDSMTDYWDPADWSGIAEKNGYILCVDVYGAAGPQEIRKYKAMAEEAAEIQKAFEAEVIACMVEHNIDTEITESAKITYKSQLRATLDKKRLEEDLGSLEEYTNVTEYNVLRIK